MSLKHNIIANYTSQIYVAGIGILILPLYIKYMGVESYGLIGFFSMLQVFFAMLDLGLTPTISRESSRYNAGSIKPLEYKQLHRALSLIFFIIALVGGSLLYSSSSYISEKWLNVEDLSVSEVELAVKIMSITIVLRWLCGLYRGVIVGAERLVWLSVYNILIATMRFILVLPIMWWFGATPEVFFIYQLLVAILEIIIIYKKGSMLLPHKREIIGKIGWSLKPIESVFKLSLTIAFTSLVWSLVGQTDKLVLSGALSLTEYGYFSLAIMLASGIMVLSTPIASAIMPRMVRLYSENKKVELFNIYKSSTQIVVALTGSAAVILTFFSYDIMLIWTGSEILASKTSPILKLYAVNYGLLSIGAFPFYMQYAQGNLRYHLLGNIFLLVVMLPVLVFFSKLFGAIGAGWVLLFFNGLYATVWAGFVHSKIAPNLHFKWLTNDILSVLFIPTIFVIIVKVMIGYYFVSNKALSISMVLIIGFITLFSAAMSSSYLRRSLLNELIKNPKKQYIKKGF